MIRKFVQGVLKRNTKEKTRIEKLNDKYAEIARRGVNASTAQSRYEPSYNLEEEDVVTGHKHVLHKQRKNRLVFKPDREILENSTYPAEYPSTHVPIPEPDVPNHRGRRILAYLYRQYKELYNRHRNHIWFNYTDPKDQQAGGVWVAPTATVIGDVWMADYVNVWYGAILRGDKNSIEIGGYTNVQDGAIITTDDRPNLGGFESEVSIGGYCTIGHGAKLHACKIGHEVMIGMNATVLEGAVIEDESVIAAGSVVPPGRRIPSHELWAGNPAKFIRKLGHEEVLQLKTGAVDYYALSVDHSLEFTTTPMQAYKEVDNIVDKLEETVPDTKDDRPAHWGVWHDMSKKASVPFWKKDRIL